MATSIPRSKLAQEAIEQLKVAKLKKAGLIGIYAQAESIPGKLAYQRAIQGSGTYFWGLPGGGKTYSAACAVRLAIENGMRAKLVTTAQLLADIRAGFDGDTYDALAAAERIELLALDDLGAEQVTEWAKETITRLIDTRSIHERPTIITSNYRAGELRDIWGSMAGARLVSRIAGACVSVHISEPDRRLKANKPSETLF